MLYVKAKGILSANGGLNIYRGILHDNREIFRYLYQFEEDISRQLSFL